MALIDWRELYAANRASIERSRTGGQSARPGPPRAGWPRPSQGARRVRRGPDERGAGGAGAWERIDAQGRAAWLYTPPGVVAGASLVLMLHGCTQTAADLARGTRMNEAADRHGFRVAYPEQSGRHNPRGCWNWFLPGHQARGAGEPAELAELTRGLIARAAVEPGRVLLAGMSAGAAMAAVMGATHPELFAALALHSGLPYAAVASTREALELMSRGGADAARCGRSAFEAMGERARPLPAIVIHGDSDPVVAPSNGDATARQWLVTNRLAASGGRDAEPGAPSSTSSGRSEAGLSFTLERWSDPNGQSLLSYLKVTGLGHAWSGGSPDGSYADARGPDATEAICAFFGERAPT